MGCEVEMPYSEFFEPNKIGLRLGHLKNIIKNSRVQLKKEGADGFLRVIWEISAKMHIRKILIV